MSKRKKRPKLREIYQRPPLELMKCKAESEDICRALYCPKARGNKAYCPWEKNGHMKIEGTRDLHDDQYWM